VAARVIEIDGRQINFTGNAAGYLDSEHFAALLRQMAGETHFVKIAVSGRQFEDIAATQDRVAESGRYERSSQVLLKRGQMVAPIEHYSVSVKAESSRRNEIGWLASLIGQTDLDLTKAKAKVGIVLEPINIRSGISNRAIRVTASDSELVRVSLGSGSWRNQLRYDSDKSDPEAGVVAAATEKALVKLIAQLDQPEPIKR